MERSLYKEFVTAAHTHKCLLCNLFGIAGGNLIQKPQSLPLFLLDAENHPVDKTNPQHTKQLFGSLHNPGEEYFQMAL